jgi:hypothetical protein
MLIMITTRAVLLAENTDRIEDEKGDVSRAG